MPKFSKPKTVKELEALQEPGQYPVGGVPGLYLVVTRSNAKSYAFRYTVPGSSRRTMVGLGAFNSKTLVEARREAYELQDQVSKGIDPLLERDKARKKKILENKKQAVSKAKKLHTVETCITAFLDELAKARYWMHNIRGESVARSYVRRNVFPVIGAIPIEDLTPQDVFKVVRPIWQTQINAAPETLNWIRRSYDWAKAKGWCSGDNPADRNGALGVLLAPLNKNRKKVENLGALSVEEIPKFLAVCLTRIDNSYQLLAFSIVTVLRAKMARKLQWDFYDAKEKNLDNSRRPVKDKRKRKSYCLFI